MAAQDMAHHKVWGDVTADLLKRLDMKVDFAAVDWGTVVARMQQKSPPGQGGWQMTVFSLLWHRECRPDQQISTCRRQCLREWLGE